MSPSGESSPDLHHLSVTCMSCGRSFPGDRALSRCPECGGLLDADIDLERTLTPASFEPQKGTIGAMSGVWRFRSLLPDIADEHIVTRYEGHTPALLERPRQRVRRPVQGPHGRQARGP